MGARDVAGDVGAAGRPAGPGVRLPVVRRTVRLFVYGFLAAFVVCGVGNVDLWPFTGWQLFSRLRTTEAPTWEVTVVAADGAEQPLPFAHLPAGYRAWLHVAADLPNRSPQERRRVCEAWAAAAGRVDGSPVARVRIYTHGPGARPRVLTYSCAPPAAP